jgi:predicted  nucleic acid-binding Zn-ribbon protein
LYIGLGRNFLKEQIILLRELQDTEVRIRGLKNDQERYPREIDQLNEKLSSEKETASREKERLEFLERERRRKEGELDGLGEKIKKSKGRLFEVKSNKEYQALLHEIGRMEESTSRNEDEILALLDEIDELRGSVSQREGDLVTVEKETQDEVAKIEGALTHIVKEIDAAEKQRKKILASMNPDLVKAYETLKQRRGRALALVKRGVCQGCYVNIPPQMFNEVQRNDTLIRCPNCNRFLFWDNNKAS